jgi:hypothetical protein
MILFSGGLVAMEELGWRSYEEFSDYLSNEDLFTDLMDFETQRFGSVACVTKDFINNYIERPLEIN